MNLTELEDRLRSEAPDAPWLVGAEEHDYHSITFENGRWSVFCTERGRR